MLIVQRVEVKYASGLDNDTSDAWWVLKTTVFVGGIVSLAGLMYLALDYVMFAARVQ